MGSGVTFLANSPYTLTTKESTIAFKETKFGYIPDGGSTFLLSRLSGEIGAYLALTGKELNYGDMKQLRLSDGFIQDENYLKDHLAINLVNRNLSFSLNTSSVGYEKFEENYQKIQKEKHDQNPFGINDVLSINGKMKMDYLDHKYKEPYQYPWMRNPDENKEDFNTTPFTHLFNKEIYGEDLRREINASYRNYERTYTNTFTNFEKQVLFGILENSHELGNLEGVIKKINKYFRFNSVKEIMEALKENIYLDPFAAECYEEMKNKSFIAMEISLALIRKAKNLNYSECQRMEMNAAKNLIMKSTDLENYYDNRAREAKNKNNNKRSKIQEANTIFEKDYSKDFIRELLEKESGTEKIELEIKENSILPNKSFRDAFPDAFRIWINEHPRANKTIREFFDYEIKHYMMEKLGIDLRDTKITIEEVRKVIADVYVREFANEKNNEKVYNLVCDSNFINEYIKTRKEYCDKFLSEADSIPKLKSLITTKTKEIFEKSFKQTCNNILHKCKDVRDIEKRRTWQRLRKWIFSNRIMTYKTKSKIMQNLRIESLGNKNLYIPLDESKSWREEIDPEIKKSAFYQLAGLFKIKKISPEYALRFSITDLNSDNLFSYLEINEEKLTEIKQIVKENPKKLIEIFNSALDKETQMLFDTLEEKDLLEYDRLYRIRNEGKSPIDEMYLVNQFQELKKKWWNYRNNILELLRKITLESVFNIVDNPKYYGKSILDKSNKKITPEEIKLEDTKNSIEEEELEDYKVLYNILKVDNDDLAFFGKANEKISSFIDMNDSNNLIESIKNSFMNSNEKVFSTIITNLITEENKQIKDFSQKTFDFTKSLILHFILDNSEANKSADKNKPIKIQDFNIKDSLEKLFSYENFIKKNLYDSEINNEASKFLHHIYLKYGTINIFNDALRYTKNTAVEILNQLTEAEISNHYNSMISKVPEKNLNKVNTIYQKEKSLFEDLLKKFYEMKINLSKLEIIQIENANNTNAEIPFEYQSIEYFIGKLQDFAFSEFIIADRTQKCPINIDLLIKKDYSQSNGISEKLKQLVELYVNLKENTLNKESEQALSALTKTMKNSEWFNLLDSYTKNIYDSNLSDLVNEYDQTKNLDLQIENFMKTKFRDFIYGKNSENIEAINKDVLNIFAEERFTQEYIEEITKKYKLDKTKLNEDKYDPGLMTKKTVIANRNHLNEIKIMLTDKINEFLKFYNVNELTKKYIDYEFNKDYHLHRILCNIVEIEAFYEVRQKDQLIALKEYIDYGEYLLNFKKMIKEAKKGLLSEGEGNNKLNNSWRNNFSKLEQIKNISFNKNVYVNQLENVKNFLEAREKYLNKIYSEFYGLFNFSEKYQISLLSNNIQADFAKLYNYLKENYETNKKNNVKLFENFSEFVVSDELFFGCFKEVNFDEFLGMENYDIIKKRIDEINELKIKEQIAFKESGINFSSDREIQNIIRNLVIEEIEKSQTFVFSNSMKIDKSIELLLEKENQIIENINSSGFNLKNNTKNLNSLEKAELINEYKLNFKNSYVMKESNTHIPASCPMHSSTASSPIQTSYHATNNTYISEKSLGKSLKEKIESKLFSLKQLSKLSNENSNQLNINLNSSDIELNKKSLEDFLNQYKEYGMKYNNTIKYMTGDKLTLRDMIVDSYDKTMAEYNNHELNPIFTDKISTDLIKTALEVLDAKLIKAVKIINSDLLNKNLNKSDKVLSNLINIIQNDNSILEKEDNQINKFSVHQDFEEIQDFKNYLERSIELRIRDDEKNEKKEKDERELRMQERDREENLVEDYAYEGYQRIYDLKKNPNKEIVNTENKKSLFDLNVNESIRNEIYENYIQEQENRKARLGESEENIYGYEEKNESENDPTKLSDIKLKAIYIKKIKDLVELPNFKNKYSVMKYIYDYYMGTLAVDYDSHLKDAEERLGLINEAVYLDRIEKTYFNYGNLEEFKKGAGILDDKYYDKLMDKNINDKITEDKEYQLVDFTRTDPMELYNQTLFPYKQDRMLYDNLKSEEEMKRLNTYRNFAFSFLKANHPSRALLPDTDRKYIRVMDYEITKYIENYRYGKLVKSKTRDQVYNKFSANLLTSTEKFRLEASKNQKRNAEISAMPYNTYDGEVGYSKLLNNNNNNMSISLDSQFDKFMDKTFANYLQTKKDKINFTKEKLKEVKETLSHSGNLLSMKNPYELIKLSNQEYIELKNFKDAEGNRENVPDTVNPNSPIKFDLETFLKANNISKEYPEFGETDITDIVELDNAMSLANYGKYSSIPNWLVDISEKKVEENYLEKYLEGSPEKFIEYAIEEIVEEFYLMRYQVEKTLTREELEAFDLDHMNYFGFENISHLLKVKLNELELNIHLTQDEAVHVQNKQVDEEIQKTKIQGNLFYHNHNNKDEDAFYKSVAYRLRLDKIKQDKIKKYFKTTNSKSKKIPKFIKHTLEDQNSTEFWYYSNLHNDRHRPNPNGKLSYEELKKEYDQKLFSSINKVSLDDNYSSEKKLENAKFLVEFGENNLHKSK